MSPWDLEPIDEDRPTNVGVNVRVLPSEVTSRLYQPRPEDWRGDRDSECDRISALLSQVMKLAIAEPFVSPVVRYPSSASIVEYPMDLSTIKTRLDNRFYRRASAVEFDVDYISTNAGKWNQPKLNIVHNAPKIANLCLEIVRGNVDTTDVAKYQMHVGRADVTADEPSTNRSGAKRNKTNIRSGNKDSAQPKTRSRVSKSKVNC